MQTDELEPVVLTSRKADLKSMSVEALDDYIAALEAEIQRARAVIAAKESARDMAEGFFKKR